MAAVAHRVGGAIDTHVTAIGGADDVEATRWYYRQRIEAALARTTRPWFLLLDVGTHPPFEGAADAHPDEIAIAVELPSLRTEVTGLRAPQLNQQTIRPDAKLLFVAGAGWTKKQPDGQLHVEDAGKLILDFLVASGASLGSSKSLVDQGGEGQSVLPFLTHLNQVGQTGSTPRHAKGLATCCHGEEPNCGWTRGKADVVYVADAFKVMERVNALIGSE
jgi:electron transfer flavoprotein alpha subunit